MTQPEKFKQYDASLTKHPNQSFIQLFFAKPNDILRFPLFFEDNPRRLEAIRGRGGLSDFSPEALKQLQDIFHALKSGDYSRYSPERVTYLDFLKNNTLHALKEYTAEYDRLENDLFRENNRIFAAEYFSRLSEITRQLGYVNGYLTMFSFSLAGYRKIEELENTIRELKRQAKLEHWRTQIIECRSSGMSVKGWCAEHNISTKTYYRWEKEILSSAATELVPTVSAPQPPAAFVELPSQPERQTGSGVVASIQIGKGKADIYSGADAAVVRAICQVLKSC